MARARHIVAGKGELRAYLATDALARGMDRASVSLAGSTCWRPTASTSR